jgi:hypothetical protein
MKMRVFILWLTMVAQVATCSARTEVEELVVQMLAEAPQKANLSVITPANRDAVVKILRDASTYKITAIGTSPLDEVGAGIILVRLNDAETISRLIGQYRDTYGSRGSFWKAGHLELAGQASVIPLLAEDFFMEDGDKSTINRDGKGGGIRVIPRSAFSGITAMRVTIASKQFSDETRAWANQRLIQGYYPYEKFRADMRLWWKQNEAAFKTGNYMAVKPPVPEPPPSLPNPEDSKRVIPTKPVMNSLPTPATPAPPPIPAPAVANAEKPLPESSIWWALVAGIAALLMIVAVVIKRRS